MYTAGRITGAVQVLVWQELAKYMPNGLQRFLEVKYGIE
jgi:hypothetical protein